MNTLSITSTKTMTYDPSAHGFAIVEKLASLTGALLVAARKLRGPAAVPAPRAARA